MKTCRDCGQTKPLDEFVRRTKRPDGRDPYCKPCHNQRGKRWAERNPERASQIQAEYYRRNSAKRRAASADWDRRHPGRNILGPKLRLFYMRLLVDQGGVCAICGSSDNRGRRLAVDHDHSCCPGHKSCGGCVRGLTCTACNLQIGHFEKGNRVPDPLIALSILRYLERSER